MPENLNKNTIYNKKNSNLKLSKPFQFISTTNVITEAFLN